jgi:hypothetical protein
MLDVARNFAHDPRWHTASLDERMAAWVNKLVSFCRRERGVMRARVLYNIQYPGSVPENRNRQAHATQAEVCKFFNPVLHEISKPDPENAMEFAMMALDYVVSYKVLLEVPSVGVFADLDDDRLIRELNVLFLSYLGVARHESPATPDA